MDTDDSLPGFELKDSDGTSCSLVALGRRYAPNAQHWTYANRPKSDNAAQQIVGRERRGLVSHHNWSRRCLNEIAPPRQLNRWAVLINSKH